MLVLVLLTIFGKLSWPFLIIISIGLTVGAILGILTVLAIVIHREKAEGPFRLFRGLPLRSQTLSLDNDVSGLFGRSDGIPTAIYCGSTRLGDSERQCYSLAHS